MNLIDQDHVQLHCNVEVTMKMHRKKKTNTKSYCYIKPNEYSSVLLKVKAELWRSKEKSSWAAANIDKERERDREKQGSWLENYGDHATFEQFFSFLR